MGRRSKKYRYERDMSAMREAADQLSRDLQDWPRVLEAVLSIEDDTKREQMLHRLQQMKTDMAKVLEHMKQHALGDTDQHIHNGNHACCRIDADPSHHTNTTIPQDAGDHDTAGNADGDGDEMIEVNHSDKSAAPTVPATTSTTTATMTDSGEIAMRLYRLMDEFQVLLSGQSPATTLLNPSP